MPSGRLHQEQRDMLGATTIFSSSDIEGQPHDRIATPDSLAAVPVRPLHDTARDHNGDIEITPAQKMLSAMSGSLFTSLIVTPLDVVRVRLQSQPQATLAAQKLAGNSHIPQSLNGLPPNLGVTACCREVFFMNNNAEICMAGPRIGEIGSAAALDNRGCAVEETQRKTINSTIDGLRKIARNEGITTLWRGLSPTLVMTVPANIIYFTGYDWLRFHKSSPVNKHFSDNYSPLIAGSSARTLAAIIVSPIEMFRTRMQASTSGKGANHFTETLTGVKEMVRASGYTSLWRGLTLTLWRDVPFSGIYWWGYETVRANLADARATRRGRGLDRDAPRERRTRSQSLDDHSATFTDSFLAGAISGAVASIVTTPFDVGKTRRQIFQDTSSSAVGAANKVAPEQLSMPKFLLQIFKEEGFAGLWKGWIPRTLKVAPGCAIMISSYEVGKRMARSVNEKAAEKAASKYV